MSRLVDTLPRLDGYAMPAEWSRHARTWMAWPERPDTWRRGAAPAQEAFTAVATAIAEVEPVRMAVSPAQHDRAAASLPAGVELVEVPTDDCWMRDIGPTCVADHTGDVRGVDWVFNAWGGALGGLYAPWDRDDGAAAEVCRLEGIDRYRAPIVLEGGSIHTDGEGTLLTTEECLLNPNRNPGLSRDDVEQHLRDHLGVDTVVWLGRGVVHDETDGHVDNLACFVRPGVVALTWTDDPDDPQHAVSRDALRRLEAARDARGRALEVHRVHQPGPLTMTEEEAAGVIRAPGVRHREAGARLAASYVNFYLAERRVVVPLLDPATDDDALAVIDGLFPDREVVGLPAREILLGGGNIHCITQQIPGEPAPGWRGAGARG
jgi:agmatine deiminase